MPCVCPSLSLKRVGLFVPFIYGQTLSAAGMLFHFLRARETTRKQEEDNEVAARQRLELVFIPEKAITTGPLFA